MLIALTDLIAEFSEKLTSLVHSQAIERARASVHAALGMSAPKRPGRPPKAAAAAQSVAKKTRKKAPLQLCPVPGCKNPAAPIFGMVCSKHKDVAKSKIKKYREVRKAKKLKAA